MMRRLQALLARESGQAMVLAVFTFAIVTSISVALVDVISSETVESAQAVASNAAYQAAEAGVDEYISKLLQDPLYYQHYVDEAESTRASGALTVTAGNAWTGGITWTYPNGKDTWKQLGNGYAYNLEITGPFGIGLGAPAGGSNPLDRLPLEYDGERVHDRDGLRRTGDPDRPAAIVGRLMADDREHEHHLRLDRDDDRTRLCQRQPHP